MDQSNFFTFTTRQEKKQQKQKNKKKLNLFLLYNKASFKLDNKFISI